MIGHSNGFDFGFTILNCSVVRDGISRCYLKLGDWKTDLQGYSEKSIPQIIQYYAAATDNDRNCYKVKQPSDYSDAYKSVIAQRSLKYLLEVTTCRDRAQ